MTALVAATRPGDPRDEHALREAVAAWARGAHRAHVAPQQLLVTLKEAFRTTACRHLTGQQVEMLLERAVTWAIRGYYGHDVGEAPPPARATAGARP